MPGPGAIDLKDNTCWKDLAEIAKFAIGSKEATGGKSGVIKGGAGRIGIIGGYVVKFNTHIGERLGGPKASPAMRDSCNALRKALFDIAKKLDVTPDTLKEIRSKLGLKAEGQIPVGMKLLNRKVVASVINLIGKDKNQNVWSGLRARDVEKLASADGKGWKLDTHFETVSPLVDLDGPVGKGGLEYFLEELKQEIKTDENPYLQARKDIPRGYVIKLGDQTLDGSNVRPDGKLTTKESSKELEKIQRAFEDFFGKDNGFAELAASMANQRATIVARQTLERRLRETLPAPSVQGVNMNRPHPYVFKFEKAGPGSMVMKFDCEYCPNNFASDVGEFRTLREVVPDKSHVRMSFECKFIKLDPTAKATGPDVIQLGENRFRAVFEPNRCTFNVHLDTQPLPD